MNDIIIKEDLKEDQDLYFSTLISLAERFESSDNLTPTLICSSCNNYEANGFHQGQPYCDRCYEELGPSNEPNWVNEILD